MKNKKILWVVWSGEGEQGAREDKLATVIGIKRILTKERCGGDRWAHACPASDERSEYCCTANEYEI